MEKAVRRDIHKMRAFVRFRKIGEGGDEHYVAWFEPEHFIVERNAPFFVRRFTGMRWSILTPYRCAHWDTAELTFTPGADKARCASGRRRRRTLADLLRKHLQPCAPED